MARAALQCWIDPNGVAPVPRIAFHLVTIKPLYPEFDDAFDAGDDPEVVELAPLDLEQELSVCLVCGTELGGSELFQRIRVCPQCGFHYNISARSRIAALVDPGTFEESHRWITSIDPLVFSPRVSYQVRVLNDQERTGLSEAAVTGIARIGGARCAIIAIDFGFLGGSMGLVVGEKVARMFELAARQRLPVITFATSGGARLQEGVLSLTQMAKTVVAARTLRERGIPLISVLANPSSGQILSSFASMSDIRIGEPGAHIAFASLGALREIEESEDVGDHANAEAMLNYGHLDMVLSRDKQRDQLSVLLGLFDRHVKDDARTRRRGSRYRPSRQDAWESVRLSRRADRPTASTYIPRLFRNFVELHGDRSGADDKGVKIGLGYLGVYPVMVIAQERIRSDEETSQEDDGSIESFTERFGYAELGRGGIGVTGFRKARRAAVMATDFRLPLVVLIDTPGPKLGIGQELSGLASEIAETINVMLGIETPVVSVVIGEGGSEAALAFSVADRMMMMENSIYTPISPEAGAATELRDRARAPEVARSLRLTSYDALEMGIADLIIAEPDGGANADPARAARMLKRELISEVSLLRRRHRRVLARHRRKRFRHIGEYGPEFRAAVRSELNTWGSAVRAQMRRVFGSGDGIGDEERDGGRSDEV
ncbi:MAG: acetyl-CoA carboxylase carboxyl transferase subunit beta [Chloroflexi bacterium]|nr:acetyl-CoA carboxylase carboxyl transferase subunit beta [Chloroflexota bacterium]